MQGSKIPRLVHIQTTTLIELPERLTIIRLGKPSTTWTPDIDVSNFPNSDIVSHSHLEIRIQGNSYFIEDFGSANGTYLNHSRLTPFTSCQLSFGDRVDLGKNELFTLIFREAKQAAVTRAITSNALTRTKRKKQSVSSKPLNIFSLGGSKEKSTNKQDPNQRYTGIFASLQLALSSLIGKLLKKILAIVLKVAKVVIVIFVVALLVVLVHKILSPLALPLPNIGVPVPSPVTQAGNPSPQQTSEASRTDNPINRDHSPDESNKTVHDKYLDFKVIETKYLNEKFVISLFEEACRQDSTTTSKIKLEQSKCTPSRLKKEASGSWLAVTLEVKNIGNYYTNLFVFGSNGLVIEDKNGKRYTPNDDGSKLYSQQVSADPSDSIQLPTQKSTRFCLLFQVSPDYNFVSDAFFVDKKFQPLIKATVSITK